MATRVLPTPPVPVKVTRRDRDRLPITSRTNSSRPTSGVIGVGKWPALAVRPAGGGFASAGAV